MYIIVLGIFILKLGTSVSQYPNHMDFQKVGEVIFNNEKFNVLKPTTHIVSDYFKEFMLRRDNTKHPIKRVFIDDNGFRHSWSGFGEKIKSLRKTDAIDLNLIANSFNAVKNNENQTRPNITVSTDENATATVESTTTSNSNLSSKDTNVNSKQSNEVSESHEGNATEKNDTVEKLFEEVESEGPETIKTTTFNFFPSTKFTISNASIFIEERLREGKEDDKSKSTTPAKSADTTKTSEPAEKGSSTKKTEPAKKNDADDSKKNDSKTDSAKKTNTTKKDGSSETNKPDKQNKKSDKLVAKTTFFCPFFGVITMAAFID